VQRVYYQAELLTAAGYDVWVVTEDAPELWIRDDSFQLQHLRQERLKRAPICPGLLGRVRRKLGKYWPTIGLYPDDHAGWRNGAFKEAINIVDREGIDIVLASLGSPSSLEVAFRLKQRSAGLRLVVDVRDLWVGNPVRFMGRGRWQPARSYRDRTNERIWLSAADSIVNVSKHHSEVLKKRYPDINEDRFFIIQNGFDEKEFENAIPARCKDDVLVIRYMGFLLPEMQANVFFDALKQLVDNDPLGGAGIRCEFFGGSPQIVEQEAEKAGVQEFVEANGYVDHKRAVSLMLGADVLLLFWTNDPGCMCGKFYEYLRAGRYILAFDQDNKDARDLLTRSRRGEWLSVNDKASHAGKLEELLEKRRKRHGLQAEQLPELSRFSRQTQIQRLAEILELRN
jgi:glycosyltransferase involved in cell wall biosynthesis